jgi:hypothetical protein
MVLELTDALYSHWQGCIQVMGVDVRDPASIDAVVAKYADTIDCVWNLAAPL